MTMITRWVRYVLRGVSQVFLQRSALTGFLMLMGLAAFSPRMAALVLLGSAAGTLAGWAAGRRDVPDGLMGYNGALVGAAADLDLAASGPAVWATVVGSFACLPVHLLLERLFARFLIRGHALPVLTAPFCVVAGALATTLHGLPAGGGALTNATTPAREGGLGLANNLSEVFLADGVTTGLLILAGLFAAGVSTGAWAVLGSLVVVAAGLLLHWDPSHLSAGLTGYSAVLVAVAVGDTFLPWVGLPWRVGLVVAGSLASVGVAQLLGHTAVPVYTWPFILVTWVVLAVVFRQTPARADA